MEEFNVKKRYAFDLDTALKNAAFRANYENGNSKYWADYCNGKEVILIDGIEGKIPSPAEDYIILPWMCKEIK